MLTIKLSHNNPPDHRVCVGDHALKTIRRVTLSTEVTRGNPVNSKIAATVDTAGQYHCAGQKSQAECKAFVGGSGAPQG